MPDIKTPHTSLFLRDDELRRGVELLYFAYRDFNDDPDEILAGKSYGRAHYRVIYFVGRNPKTSVGGLLKILRITKQSLSRVLNQLVEDGLIEQQQGRDDRRQRLLMLTAKGKEFEDKLFAAQRERMARAYRKAGPDAVTGFWKVMMHILDEDEREEILEQINKSSQP